MRANEILLNLSNGNPISTVANNTTLTYQTINSYNNAAWTNAAQNMLPDALYIVHYICQLPSTVHEYSWGKKHYIFDSVHPFNSLKQPALD